MATGTLIFRPSSDVSLGHSRSSGSNGYSLISDETPDDNSTYIYQTFDSTTSSSASSTFVLTTDYLPRYKIRVTEARLHSRATKSGNGETASYSCRFAAGTSSGGSSDNAMTSATLSNGYRDASSTSTALMNTINSLLSSGTFPVISVTVSTTGTKSDSKLAGNGYARITQVYAEFDYVIDDEDFQGSIMFKTGSSWVEATRAYKKVNGVWVEQSDLTSVFSSGINYVKG